MLEFEILFYITKLIIHLDAHTSQHNFSLIYLFEKHVLRVLLPEFDVLRPQTGVTIPVLKKQYVHSQNPISKELSKISKFTCINLCG